jgi:hypothetical protein
LQPAYLCKRQYSLYRLAAGSTIVRISWTQIDGDIARAQACGLSVLRIDAFRDYLGVFELAEPAANLLGGDGTVSF